MGSRLSGEFHANAPIFLSYSRLSCHPRQRVRLSLKLVSDPEGSSLEGLEDQRLHSLLTRFRSHRGSAAERRSGSKDLDSLYKELDLRLQALVDRFCAQIPIRPPTPSTHQSGFVEARQAGGWRTVWSVLLQTRGWLVRQCEGGWIGRPLLGSEGPRE